MRPLFPRNRIGPIFKRKRPPDGYLACDEELLEPVNRIFSRAVKTYGSDPKAAAWRDKERQFRRFQIFAGLFETVSDEVGFSVNDLGCGYGAMFEAYQNLPSFRNARYFGYDISIGMLNEARTKISDPRASWIHSHEAIHEADFSFVSGTYNLNMGADRDLWRQYIEKNLLQLWSKTRVALGFNMLSMHSPKRQNSLYYGDPDHFHTFCQTHMGGRALLVDRLAPEEFVVFVTR